MIVRHRRATDQTRVPDAFSSNLHSLCYSFLFCPTCPHTTLHADFDTSRWSQLLASCLVPTLPLAMTPPKSRSRLNGKSPEPTEAWRGGESLSKEYPCNIGGAGSPIGTHWSSNHEYTRYAGHYFRTTAESAALKPQQRKNGYTPTSSFVPLLLQ